MKDLNFVIKFMRWEMEAELSFLVLRFLVIVCAFLIHGSADGRGHVVGYDVSPAVTPGVSDERHGYPVAAPPRSTFTSFRHMSHSFSQDPTMHGSRRPASLAPAESPSQHIPRERINSLGYSKEDSYYDDHHHRWC